MGLMDFIKGELLEIIEWPDDQRETIAWRYPDEDKAIKNGAQLIVRESQMAQFVYLGQFGDAFGPGKHSLVTENIPVLTRIKGWKYGFQSPFKADVYFVNTRLFTGNKWGTSHPIMLRDADFGVVRARAFGTYDFRVVNVQTFLREVAGRDHDFRVDEFEEAMRSRLVSVFSDSLASAQVPVIDVATRYGELGDALLPLINPRLEEQYGIHVTTFVVENVSVPKEVEEALDRRAAMSAIGDMNAYIKYRMAEGMAQGGGGGAAGTAAELAAGFGVAQEMMRQTMQPQNTGLGTPGLGGGVGFAAPVAPPPLPGQVPQAPAPAAAPSASALGLPEMFDVDQAAQILGVRREDVLAEIEAGTLPAKKIGSTQRIRRSDLEAFLNG